VEPVDIGAADAQTSLSTLLERAHRARIVILDPPDHLTAPGGSTRAVCWSNRRPAP
jgi:hypothetical protein